MRLERVFPETSHLLEATRGQEGCKRRVSYRSTPSALAAQVSTPHLIPMTEITSRLSTALADRYKIERELGVGGKINAT